MQFGAEKKLNHCFFRDKNPEESPRDRKQNPKETVKMRGDQTAYEAKVSGQKPNLRIVGAGIAGLRAGPGPAAANSPAPFSLPTPTQPYLVGTCRGCGCTLWW